MKKILLGLLILVILLGIGGVYALNMSGDSVAKKDADHNLTASALYQEYSGNEKKGNVKFIGKTIEVSGTIAEMSEDQEGATVLMFVEPGQMEGVMCTIDKDQNTSSLELGQSVNVKAQCTGMLEMTGVVLNKGVILN